jgi:DNA-binding transcriptional ArsR family regulator
LLNNNYIEYVRDGLSTVFRALADPTRRAILARLSVCDATVGELAEPFDMTFQAVSRHLAVLETAGLIVRGREAQWRTSSLDPRPMQQASEWLDAYRRFWEPEPRRRSD